MSDNVSALKRQRDIFLWSSQTSIFNFGGNIPLKVALLMWFESPVMRTTVIYQPIFFFLQSFECFVCWVLTIKWNFITWIVLLYVFLSSVAPSCDRLLALHTNNHKHSFWSLYCIFAVLFQNIKSSHSMPNKNRCSSLTQMINLFFKLSFHTNFPFTNCIWKSTFNYIYIRGS